MSQSGRLSELARRKESVRACMYVGVAFSSSNRDSRNSHGLVFRVEDDVEGVKVNAEIVLVVRVEVTV